jgi:D-methionine transport system substrate-binding protein
MTIRRSTLFRRAAAATAALGLAAGLTACASDGNDDDSVITIGSTEADKSQWRAFEKKADEEGLKVEIKSFTDYNSPNPALANGDLDTNQFQHIQFLAESNVNSGEDLLPFGATEIFPMGVYSKTAKSVEDIEKAGEVVVPNDSTNGGRAILVLVQNGLVTLKKDGILAPTPNDIDTSKSKVKVTAVDASQTAVAYNDGKVASINNNFLQSAGVDANDAVIKDDPDAPEAQPYINVFVTTADQVDNADYKKLVEIWHSPEVQKAVADDTAGTAIEVKKSPEELKKILEDTEQKFRDQDKK